MAIPKYYECFVPFLELLFDEKEHNLSEINEYCAKYFRLTDDELGERTKSGGLCFYGRVGWARTYLKNAGLIKKVATACFVITDDGKDALANHRQELKEAALAFLNRYDSFKEFINGNGSNNSEQTAANNQGLLNMQDPPREIIERQIDLINRELEEKLLQSIYVMDPYKFEKLTVDLMVNMGYGKPDPELSVVTQRSRDGGVDGVLYSDEFKFDKICVQAKRYGENNVVGSPEVNAFSGAMDQYSATKGVFITSSSFSEDAKRYVNGLGNKKIQLIDGQTLVKLMIKYNLGVSTETRYEVKRIDIDYFSSDVD